MALVKCKECNGSVSTEAAACPHYGAPQQQLVPPPLPVQPKEETIYSDNAVAVTNTRVIIWGTTYALRNITSVRMTYTPPRVLGAILLLVLGLIFLLAAILAIHSRAPAPIGVYILGGAMVIGAILMMVTAKTSYHVNLSSAAGEVHALTSKKRAYIEQIVLNINKAIVKYQ
ncbi:MAG TPA: DUF6232 family protein [Verrucomicrobiae bacterium]